MSTNAYFCMVSGVRIAAPGVSKLVDPVKGQELAEAPPEPVAQESREQLAENLARSLKHAHTLEETINDLGKERAITKKALDDVYDLGMRNIQQHEAEMEQLKAAHAAELEQERNAHQAEMEQLKAAHTAALEQLTKPADADAPTAPDRTATAPPKKKNP